MADETRTRHIQLKFNQEIEIPDHTLAALHDYLNYAHCGSFLQELMSNHLVEAFNRADDANTKAMFELAWLLHNRLPRNEVWGDEKVVARWLRQSNAKRQVVRDQMVMAGWAEYIDT